MRHHRSIACIIPPVLLEELARRGGDQERDSALRTLSIDATLRTTRVHNSLVGTAANPTSVLQSVAAGTPARTVFDCHGEMPVTNPEVVRSEGSAATTDVTVNEAYDGLGDTYDFYWEQSSSATRSTTRGCRSTACVHYGDALRQRVLGRRRRWSSATATARCSRAFTNSLDVIGHELTHGVTAERGRPRSTSGQSGALNESISDVFGSLVKQYARGQTRGRTPTG